MKKGCKTRSKKRYIMGGNTATPYENNDDDHVDSIQPVELDDVENVTYGTRGDAPRGVIAKIRDVVDYKRAHANFAHRHNLKLDSEIIGRFWLDREHFIDVDVFDPGAVSQAEKDIYNFKRNPAIVKASKEYIAQKQSKAKDSSVRGIMKGLNPEALKDLYGAQRKDVIFVDKYGRRIHSSDISDIDRILSGNAGLYTSATIKSVGKKKKIRPSQIANWFTDAYKRKTKKPKKQRK